MPSSIAYPWRNEMTIANRSIMFQQEEAGWKNPYVTDGLVAMWDGVWNVGGGQTHDQSSQIWYDCIGGLPIVNVSPSVYFSGGNGLTIQNLSTANFVPVGRIPGTIDQYGWRQLEIVVTIGDGISSNYPYIMTLGKRGIWLNLSANSVGCSKVASNTFVAQGFELQVGVPFSVSCYFGDGESSTSAWLNGAAAEHTGPKDTWTQNDINKNGIAFGYGISAYQFFGTIHAVRCYSRSLTADEVAANYSVDAKRFNLTGGGGVNA